MARLPPSLPLSWETQTEFWSPALSCSSPGYHRHLSLCLSSKMQINKSKNQNKIDILCPSVRRQALSSRTAYAWSCRVGTLSFQEGKIQLLLETTFCQIAQAIWSSAIIVATLQRKHRKMKSVDNSGFCFFRLFPGAVQQSRAGPSPRAEVLASGDLGGEGKLWSGLLCCVAAERSRSLHFTTLAEHCKPMANRLCDGPCRVGRP